ncbi:glycosyltransferase [Chlamydiota bacterium]
MEYIKISFICFYFLILILLSCYGVHRYYLVYLYYKYKKRTPVETKPFLELPRVTVQLPIYNEYHVVDRLIDSVCCIEYPQALLDIQILDDSTDETRQSIVKKVAAKRKEGFDIVHIQREVRTGFKAGALDNGLRSAKGKFILIFDADFVPEPTILQKTIHHFTNEFIGMVQIRWGHINREYSLLTQIQSIFLDGHFMIEHFARNRSGRFFNFNGTCGIWRKKAIYDAGGWQSDTLTEDLDLSYRAQLAGWGFLYLPELVAPGELPVDLKSFKAQQYRWAKGAIQTAKKLLPAIWRSKTVPLRSKVEASFHLTDNVAYVLLLILSILFFPALFIRLEAGIGRVLSIDVPLFLLALFSISSFYICSQKEIYGKWIDRIKYLPFLTCLGIGLCVNNARATIEALFNIRTPFNRTPKYGVISREDSVGEKKYYTKKSKQFLCELILGFYFSILVFYSLFSHQMIILPFLILFQCGFLYTGFITLIEEKSFQKKMRIA